MCISDEREKSLHRIDFESYLIVPILYLYFSNVKKKNIEIEEINWRDSINSFVLV